MTATILKFPVRHRDAIAITRWQGGGWLVRVFDQGWAHGARADAVRDAEWLAANWGLPIESAS
jgi:hypothetical protein